ncbi:MAG: hypothetical protein GY822_20130 [Deltaproteobacteria bacterium]|nr:hypothetical protein [Deltaproteobacteria bacterium]
MFIEMNANFRAQCKKFDLAYCCEECVYFIPDDKACSIFYPTDEHRRAKFKDMPDGGRVRFCKMFESVERA